MGNLLGHQYLILVFKEAMDHKIDDQHGQMVQLSRFTEEENREKTKHHIQQPLDIGHNRAKLLLKQRYGDPH